MTITANFYCNSAESLKLEQPEEIRGLNVRGGSFLDAGVPLYPKNINHPDIQDVVRRAVEAATDVLDELFPGVQSQETRGINSNFVGTLEEHITAMLTGKEGAVRSYRRTINALFANEDVFGVVPGCGAKEGVTVVQPPANRGLPALYFDSDRKAFVELEQLEAGPLFTSSAAAVDEVLEWLESHEVSPRSVRLKLCVLSFAQDEGLKVVTTAS